MKYVRQNLLELDKRINSLLLFKLNLAIITEFHGVCSQSHLDKNKKNKTLDTFA